MKHKFKRHLKLGESNSKLSFTPTIPGCLSLNFKIKIKDHVFKFQPDAALDDVIESLAGESEREDHPKEMISPVNEHEEKQQNGGPDHMAVSTNHGNISKQITSCVLM